MTDEFKIRFSSRFLKSPLARILTHSWFIATILGVVAYYLLHYSPEPYLFDRVLMVPLDDQSHRSNYYADLNSDGKSEQFGLANSNNQNSWIIVSKASGNPQEQWHFKGAINREAIGYYLGNYDRDSFSEIAVFSVQDRLIYLNIIEPFDAVSHKVKDRLIDSIRNTDDNSILSIYDAQFYDLNRDGSDELIYSLAPDMALQPRKVYVYDIKADSLWGSPISGMAINSFLITDYDHDGKSEIFCRTYAPKNYPNGGVPFPDTVSWFLVFNDRLEYKVAPVPTIGEFGNTTPVLLSDQDTSAVYAVVNGEENNARASHWYRVNRDFSLSKANPLSFDSDSSAFEFTKSSDKMGLLIRNSLDGQTYFINDGKISGTRNFGMAIQSIPLYNYSAGIKEIEYAVHIGNGIDKLFFLNSKGHKLGKISLKVVPETFRACWMGVIGKHRQILISGEKNEYTYTVRRNPWYFWQYLILIGLILGFYGFIAIIRYIQSQQFARQENIRKEVLELQLKAVRNQLDPHFTFNALNTLSGLSLTGDKNGVDHFIGHFSRLLRVHLQTSDNILVSLGEEIEFVVSYVELQRIRFENAFRLELDILKEIDLGRQIPKMMIQTHVENAIKHGLRGLGHEGTGAQGHGEGKVWVRVREIGEGLEIIIEDNGVGRGNSTVSAFESTGKGLMSLEKIRESVKQLYGIRVVQGIEDLFGKDGKPAGTRVTITIED